MKAILKFFLQILVSLFVVWHGIRIDILNIPFLGWQIQLGVWAVPLTVFWIVAVTNAINLVDGLDGLAVGISTISAITLVVVSLLAGDPVVALLA
ncbi:MraY family glycosyltransferase, partial [Treponema sp. R6D11]